MIVPCKDISSFIKQDLKRRVQDLSASDSVPKLVTIHVGESKEQESYVAIKRKMADELGIVFEYIHIPKPPTLINFMKIVREHCRNENTGIIIQQPLPPRLQSDTIYNFIPLLKEIEGHKNKSPFMPPLGLAILTILKYVFVKNEIGPHLYPDQEEDSQIFKTLFKTKKVVLLGRGQTGGLPIGNTLTAYKINYINVNSQTPNPTEYISQADVVITAAGKKIITPDMLKPGATLLNVGLHQEGKKLIGDYDERKIKNVAGWYTQTPGGLGPIDVLYLFKNLVDAAHLSVHARNKK